MLRGFSGHYQDLGFQVKTGAVFWLDFYSERVTKLSRGLHKKSTAGLRVRLRVGVNYRRG